MLGLRGQRRQEADGFPSVGMHTERGVSSEAVGVFQERLNLPRMKLNVFFRLFSAGES